MDSVFLFTFSGTFQIFYNEQYYFPNHNRKKRGKKKQKEENKPSKRKKPTGNLYSSGSIGLLRKLLPRDETAPG